MVAAGCSDAQELRIIPRTGSAKVKISFFIIWNSYHDQGNFTTFDGRYGLPRPFPKVAPGIERGNTARFPAMLTVSQLSKSFAGRALFDDVSLQVPAKGNRNIKILSAINYRFLAPNSR